MHLNPCDVTILQSHLCNLGSIHFVDEWIIFIHWRKIDRSSDSRLREGTRSSFFQLGVGTYFIPNNLGATTDDVLECRRILKYLLMDRRSLRGTNHVHPVSIRWTEELLHP